MKDNVISFERDAFYLKRECLITGITGWTGPFSISGKLLMRNRLMPLIIIIWLACY